VRKNVFSIHSSINFVLAIFVVGCSSPQDAVEKPSGTGAVSSGAGGSTSSTASGGGNTGGGNTGGGSNPGSSSCLAGTLIDDLENKSQWSAWKINKDTSGGMITPSTTFVAEPSTDGHGFAAHVSGSGFTQWGAGLIRAFDPSTACAPTSKGVRFRAKGPGTIAFAAAVRQVLPPADGGTCMVLADCYNEHETAITLTASWADYNVDWTSLAQPAWGPRVAFQAGDLLQLLFTARVDAQPFNFWVDDIALVGGTTSGTGGTTGGAGGATGGTGGATGGTGGANDAGPPGSCVLDGVLGQSIFNGWFPGRASVYTYAGLCTAVAKPLYARFANSGDATADKREVAAFFAHVAWETGNLVFTDQQSKDPATGMYWGRGPLQLTWDYNYNACGVAIGQPLLAQPDLVSKDSVVTWESALWFWLFNDSGKGFTSHDAILRGNFGDTLRVINSIECVAGNAAQQARISNYTRFASQLMVDPGTLLTCQ